MKIEINETSITIDGIEYEKKEQPTPKDGEVWYVETSTHSWIYIYRDGTDKTSHYLTECINVNFSHSMCSICEDSLIKTLRPATCEEITLLHTKLKENGKVWNAEKKVLEDLPKPLKEGDLAIFWDDEKRFAVIGEYLESMGESTFTFFKHIRFGGVQYVNAIPFESVEQFNKFRKS